MLKNIVLSFCFGGRASSELGIFALKLAVRQVAVNNGVTTFDIKKMPEGHTEIILPHSNNALLASVSHKHEIGVGGALFAEKQMKGQHIGIDIECKGSLRKSMMNDRSLGKDRFSKKILTHNELEYYNQWLLDSNTVDDTLLLLFSMKESIYKAISPIVRRYVSYKEVEVYLSMKDIIRHTVDIPACKYSTMTINLNEISQGSNSIGHVKFLLPELSDGSFVNGCGKVEIMKYDMMVYSYASTYWITGFYICK